MPASDAYSALIHASVGDIIAALLDFERYPEWQTGVMKCTVTERDSEGRGSLVEMYVDAKVRKIRYRARYFYDLDNATVGWDYVDGDLEECSGRYQLTPRGGSTTVSIDIVTEVGFFLPPPIKRLLRDQALKNAMRDLTRRVGGSAPVN